MPTTPPPVTLLNEAENEAALREIEALWDSPPGSDGDLRLEALVTAVCAFEELAYPIGTEEIPAEFLIPDRIELTPDSAQRVLDLIDHPRRPSPALRRALLRLPESSSPSAADVRALLARAQGHGRRARRAASSGATAQVGPSVSPIGQRVDDDIEPEIRGNPDARAAHDHLAPLEALARAVIRHRMQHGLSQTVLARQIGTSLRTISRVEPGYLPVRAETCERIRAVIGELPSSPSSPSSDVSEPDLSLAPSRQVHRIRLTELAESLLYSLELHTGRGRNDLLSEAVGDLHERLLAPAVRAAAAEISEGVDKGPYTGRPRRGGRP